MNAIQIKQILRRERDADDLIFTRQQFPEFYFKSGKLKFPLFEWPPSNGFTLIVWFKNDFQLLLKGDDDKYQLQLSQNILSFNGSSKSVGELNDWNLLALTQTNHGLNMTINGQIILKDRFKYPPTRLWDDCSLITRSGVGDFVIFKEILKDEEISNIGKERFYKGKLFFLC